MIVQIKKHFLNKNWKNETFENFLNKEKFKGKILLFCQICIKNENKKSMKKGGKK